MSLIGTLSQFNLSSVLQRIEAYAKTGLLTVKQGPHLIELYFRDGRLMCIGPVRTNVTLGERLLQDGVITSQMLREALQAIGSAEPSETRIALTLMDRHALGQEALRSWANRNALDVLNVLMLWPEGEVHFDEGVLPGAERLLIAVSVSQLLTSMPLAPVPPTPVLPVQQTPAPQATPPGLPRVQTTPVLSTEEADRAQSWNIALPRTAIPPGIPTPQQATTPRVPPSAPPVQLSPAPVKKPAEVKEAPAKINAASLFDVSAVPTSLPSTEALAPVAQGVEMNPMGGASLSGMLQNSSAAAPLRPEPVMNPVPPPRMDTSFMRPDMVLIPADLSSFRAQNPQFQMTPEQWRLLTRVDGKTALQTACQDLAITPDMLCQVAGELMAMGLIHVAPISVLNNAEEMFAPTREASPAPTDPMQGGYMAPGYAATTASPWSPAMPSMPDPMQGGSPFSSGLPFETESQWGNGGNGATFVPGQGWIASNGQPSQPLNTTGTLASGIY
ncbi:DUF4388 domain-containing protein [Ktedonobacter racemifer]|uniref:PatA-like N-terminal domain-containing protein n=1 Tax=Ktedonobacter racemifer DSM 44963 TaxID=485913 RepID=D6TLA3_KTERA|nr:DUF4388 domain-containing protein [Ktedonobacter racemifer]EFH86553.1 hypothetical protein Krac_7855 [Ktedonobacter racemifer DSM 44963]